MNGPYFDLPIDPNDPDSFNGDSEFGLPTNYDDPNAYRPKVPQESSNAREIGYVRLPT